MGHSQAILIISQYALRKVKCNECDRSFSSKSTLFGHQKSEHEVAWFKCNCDKLYRYRTNWARHKRTCNSSKTKSYKPAKFASVWCCFRNVFFTIFFNCRNDLFVWIELFKFNYTIRVIIIICCIIHVLVVFTTKEVFKKYKVADFVCVFLLLAFCTICFNPPLHSEMPVPSKDRRDYFESSNLS